ncbi:hypothetical protein G647_03754 [Cladophialophora carrionii CBS 160.54]|uniref:Ribosomal RNA-processing protein 15 n=1 Tax=Cladophialophora carrionii CBS 160.54 TaxID=1279043 RepID=V9DC28_9EURO|nr:uncharacterized protein G647_03754 [Cladophialophora carrionii CBS 160.54]ETI24385.1 hypothetical protein G647_03754 [Cladophialophora carrionii CBS 160.54]
MAPLSSKKRKVEDGIRGKTDRPKKRFRKQRGYHSSSEDEAEEEDQGFKPVSLEDSDEDSLPAKNAKQVRPGKAEPVAAKDDSDEETREEDEDANSENAASSVEDGGEEETHGVSRRKHTSKRNDPQAFSTSISKILSTKLSQSARKDPVLSRSKDAVETSAALANERLEKKAKAKLRADRKEDLERGRVKDVLGLSSGQAGDIAEEEKRLRKIAQRGVVKLFNAVRAAQVKAEQAAKEERKKGTIGMANRQEKVNEISKQGFLELIGGKKNIKSNTPVS